MAWRNKLVGNSSPAAPETAATSAKSRVEPTPEEQMAAAVKHLRMAAERAAQADDSKRWDKVTEDKAKLDRARKFIKEANIDRALCRVLAEIWHWPSWSTNNPADFAELRNSLGFEAISGGEERTSGEAIKTIAFRRDGREYEIRFERHTGYLPADPNVVVLDPCCGTGAYLLEVARCIAAELKREGDENSKNTMRA